jgi:ribonuclease M5
MIRILAKTSGIMIATDSDASGFKIRNFLKSAVTDGEVIHVYIPDILGKEKRKDSPSKEGKLGVEGIPPDILLDLFEKAGANGSVVTTASEKITKIHLFEDGLTGGPDSRQKRSVLLKNLRLPEHLSTNSLIPVLNSMMSLSEYKGLIHDISQN